MDESSRLRDALDAALAWFGVDVLHVEPKAALSELRMVPRVASILLARPELHGGVRRLCPDVPILVCAEGTVTFEDTRAPLSCATIVATLERTLGLA